MPSLGIVGSRSTDVVSMLLKASVDVNHKNMLGMNALLLVSGYGNDQLVRMVLDAGAQPNATNDFGHTALHLAIVGKRSQVCHDPTVLFNIISFSLSLHAVALRPRFGHFYSLQAQL